MRCDARAAPTPRAMRTSRLSNVVRPCCRKTWRRYPTCCPLVRFSKMLRATGHARMVSGGAAFLNGSQRETNAYLKFKNSWTRVAKLNQYICARARLKICRAARLLFTFPSDRKATKPEVPRQLKIRTVAAPRSRTVHGVASRTANNVGSGVPPGRPARAARATGLCRLNKDARRPSNIKINFVRHTHPRCSLRMSICI